MNENEIKDLINILENQCNNAPYDYCIGCNCNECRARVVINAGYRQIADDEIVIKQTDYVELNKDFYDWKKEYDHNCLLRLEVFELEKQLEKAKKETAREILQVLKDNTVNRIGTKYAVIDLTDITQRANELGIELEDKDNDDK